MAREIKVRIVGDERDLARAFRRSAREADALGALSAAARNRTVGPA